MNSVTVFTASSLENKEFSINRRLSHLLKQHPCSVRPSRTTGCSQCLTTRRTVRTSRTTLEDSIATVFRQVAMNRFEDACHTERREVGEISVERFGDLWESSQRAMLGDSVEITEGYRNWWSYILISSPLRVMSTHTPTANFRVEWYAKFEAQATHSYRTTRHASSRRLHEAGGSHRPCRLRSHRPRILVCWPRHR